MSAAHILVVDADPEVRTLLWRRLEGIGFVVTLPGDGSVTWQRYALEGWVLVTNR
jgi:CheY-like chemotaxis protein